MIQKIRSCLVLAALVLSLAAQFDDYSFYPSFRTWLAQTFPHSVRSIEDGSAPSLPWDTVLDQYSAKLRAENVPQAEIERRATLVRTKLPVLENYLWNRYLTSANANFNHDANAFLVEIVNGRTPGAALDVGAGEGRNSVFLASKGWKVTAVDPADKALAVGQSRAAAAGTPFSAVVSLDTAFDFGHNKWDLILYSWYNPAPTAAKAVEGLAPGGILVFEGAEEWSGMNGMLKMFPTLRVIRYEDVKTKSDFYARREMQIVRFCAEKMK